MKLKRISLPFAGDGMKKYVRIMKLTWFLILALTLQTSASLWSQTTSMSIKLKNTSLLELFMHIEKNSGYRFFYNNDDVDVNHKVSVNAKDMAIGDILERVFKDSPYSFKELQNRMILVESKSNLVKSNNFSQQQKPVSGTVIDEAGQPLPGVTILIKGTTQGVVTDSDGNYSLSSVPADATLVFSFVGMRTREIPVSGRTSIDVTMQEETIGIEEVVAIGYGTMRKSDLTGNVSRVTTAKTIDLPNTNVLQILKGNVAGLSIGTPDRPGESPSLKVRGTNSISAGNSPLIVIDGIIYNGTLSNLNIGDIESVDVLKDASAAAVYGSRSANGVLIITTKKGTSEKPVFNFNGSYGVSDPVKALRALGPDDYIQKVLDERESRGEEANPANIHDYLTITESNNLKAGKSIDWYDKLVNQSTFQNYNLSVSGRTDKTNYFISGSYNKTEGIQENDNFERITARINFSNKITDWFTVSVRSSFSQLDYSGVAVPFFWALSPYSNYYVGGADSGELEEYPMEDTFFRNPFMNLFIDDHEIRTDLWGVISSEIEIPFIDGLKWTMNYSLNSRRGNHYRFTDNRLAKTTNGSAYKDIQDRLDWTLDNIVNYKRIFKNVHSVDATFLYSREYQRATSTYAGATNFVSQALGYNALEMGGTPMVSSAYGEQFQEALMGRLNYIYNNKYAITGTVRRDGFSGFAEGNKYATFISGALAWTVSEEAFMQDVSWIDRLKVRLSYGENGNQAIGRYQTLARMSNREYVYGDGGGTSTGFFVSSMANNQLGWETTKVINLGLDFGIFNNLVNGSIDVYSSDTENLLMQRSIPSMTGYTSVWTNLGKIHNEGIEIALNSTPVKTSDFTWDVGFIFDLNRNSIESLFGADKDGDGIEDDYIASNWFIGEPLGVYFGYNIDGIHQIGDTDIPAGYQPGDFRIIDYDGDGELTADDRYIYGYSIPSYKFSISNTLQYKNWSLYAMVNSIQGGGKKNYYMGNNIGLHHPNSPFDGWSQRFNVAAKDYWTPTNPSNTVARIDYAATRDHRYLEDRSFVRIQDVILSYTFDNKILNKLQMAGLRLFLTGKNLYTFTKWTGIDPENATSIGNVARGNVPLMRSFTAGVDLKF